MKLKKLLTIFITLTLLSVGLVYAALINTQNGGFQVLGLNSVGGGSIISNGDRNKGNKKKIELVYNGIDYCKVVTNGEQLDVFVPTATKGEYDNFISNLPSNVSISDCTSSTPPPTPVNGVCNNSIINSCTAGTLHDISNTSTYYRWYCYGIGGGSNSSLCSKSIPTTQVNGVCNSTHNLCIAGTSVDTTDTNTQYLWNCNGINGGTNVSCSENIQATGQGPKLVYSKTFNGSAESSFLRGTPVYQRVETTSPNTDTSKIKACIEYDSRAFGGTRNDTHCGTDNSTYWVYLEPRPDWSVISGILQTNFDSYTFPVGYYRSYVYNTDLGFNSKIQTDFTLTGCTGTWSNTSTCSETCGGGVYEEVYTSGSPSSAYCPSSGTTRWSETTCNTQSCTPQKVDGKCDYNGAIINECSSGTFANPSSNAHYSFWDCLGINGGENVSCQQAEDNSCLNQLNGCTVGTALNIHSDSVYNYWDCNSNYGPNIECSLPKPVDGVCKTGRTVVNQCESGLMVDTTDSWIEYKWNCNGVNGGNNVQCTTPINVCGTNGLNTCRTNWNSSNEIWRTNCEVEWTCSRSGTQGSFSRSCLYTYQTPPSNEPPITYQCQ